MISLNKFLMVLICAITMSSVVKAEGFDLSEQLETAKKTLAKIDTEDLKQKVYALEAGAQKFFTTNPTASSVLGSFFIGRGLVNYEKANQAPKYIHTIESQNIFVRSCKKAARRNMKLGLLLVGGNIFYNYIQKNEKVVENKQENVLSPSIKVEQVSSLVA